MTLIGGLKRNAWGERKGHTIPHHTRKIKKKHKTKKKQPKISIHVYLHSYKLYSCVCLLVWEVHELSHSGHMTVGGWEHNNAALLQAEWDLWLELPQIMVTKVGKGGGGWWMKKKQQLDSNQIQHINPRSLLSCSLAGKHMMIEMFVMYFWGWSLVVKDSSVLSQNTNARRYL